MKPILIAKVGATVAPLLERRGDFHDWIRERMTLSDEATPVSEPHLGDSLPAIDTISGVIVTGSSAMITEGETWIARAEAWLAEVLEAKIPIFGICFGHQMLARVAGGRVDWNSNGREIGTVEVSLADAASQDALFCNLPRTLHMQSTHSQSVVELPSHATHLGSNEHDANQAFAIGDYAWGVQFHPEFDADVLRGYLEERREVISSEGIDVDARLAETRDSEHGRTLLRSFEAIVRERAES